MVVGFVVVYGDGGFGLWVVAQEVDGGSQCVFSLRGELDVGAFAEGVLDDDGAEGEGVELDVLSEGVDEEPLGGADDGDFLFLVEVAAEGGLEYVVVVG